MDISMPEQDGIESMRQIIKTVGSKVLILSVYLEHHVISEAVSAGASGYLAKESLDHELFQRTHVVHGGTVFHRMFPNGLRNPSKRANRRQRSLESLTAREREVFFALAEANRRAKLPRRCLSVPKPCIRTGNT